MQLLEDGGTHVGVATDHVIESFRNDLWAGYKPAPASSPCCAQIPPARRRSDGDGRGGLGHG